MSVKSKHGSGGEYNEDWHPPVRCDHLPHPTPQRLTNTRFARSMSKPLLLKPPRPHQTMPLPAPLAPHGVWCTSGLRERRRLSRAARRPRRLPCLSPRPCPHQSRICQRGLNGDVSYRSYKYRLWAGANGNISLCSEPPPLTCTSTSRRGPCTTPTTHRPRSIRPSHASTAVASFALHLA